MKYKVGQKVKYFADDTEKYYFGIVKNCTSNLTTNLNMYKVTFDGGDFWMFECDLQEVV